jgi:hypothetical protein
VLACLKSVRLIFNESRAQVRAQLFDFLMSPCLKLRMFIYPRLVKLRKNLDLNHLRRPKNGFHGLLIDMSTEWWLLLQGFCLSLSCESGLYRRVDRLISEDLQRVVSINMTAIGA